MNLFPSHDPAVGSYIVQQARLNDSASARITIKRSEMTFNASRISATASMCIPWVIKQVHILPQSLYNRTMDSNKYRTYFDFTCEGCQQVFKRRTDKRNQSLYCRSCRGRKTLTKHNESFSRIYKIWQGMRQRCQNPKDYNFKHYGGRGSDRDWETDSLCFVRVFLPLQDRQ